MSTRPAGRWPVSRTTAKVIAVALVALVVAVKVPATRGGLFLLAAAAVAVVFIVRDVCRARRNALEGRPPYRYPSS